MSKLSITYSLSLLVDSIIGSVMTDKSSGDILQFGLMRNRLGSSNQEAQSPVLFLPVLCYRWSGWSPSFEYSEIKWGHEWYIVHWFENKGAYVRVTSHTSMM